ncbi:MAG: Stp1/IreP family PP2C-type Ser/Thr phosphatase [Aristaeellaceae bacterium]
MKVFVQTDTGRVRPINEDSYYLPREGERFCAIADGMGGHNAGEIASAMAVRVFSGEMRMCRWIDGASMRRSVERANAAVHARSRCVEQYSGMGTTFTALALNNGSAYVAHVGDSRAYLIRRGSILRITVDHTLVEEMVRKGLITPQEAKHHPKRNYITRALGTADQVTVDLMQIALEPGDVFFLCTDGLSNHLEDRDILELTQSDCGWEEKLQQAVQAALDDGGSDNITAMYVVTGEEDR